MIDPLIEPAHCRVSFERVIRATPQQAFDAWTQADQVAKWWHPDGQPLVRCQIDLRVGGTFAFVTDERLPFVGTYQIIEPPHRLVFLAMGTVGTVLMKAEGAGTRLSVILEGSSTEQFEDLLKRGIPEGTRRTLENFVRFLGESS